MCETCGCTAIARSRVYEFISAGFSYPDVSLVQMLQGRGVDTESRLSALEDRPSLEALMALWPAITSSASEKLEADYLQTFGHTISKECPPYETEYGQSHIFQKSDTLADIAGFYRAFGLELASGFNDRLDCIGVELEFMHFLCLKEAYALAKGHSEEQLLMCRDAQAKFLKEHLGQWAFGFAGRLEERGGGSFYALLGGLLRAFLTFETRRVGLEPVEADRPLSLGVLEEDPGCETCPLLTPTMDGLVSHEAIRATYGGAGGEAPAGGLGVSPRYSISPSPAGEGARG